MRWDRAAAYLDEIKIDAGENPIRPEPFLPEIEKLDKLLLKHLVKNGS